ncbi:MAG: hypothetical protein KDJ37_03525 [Hyphomicrobiaceae bacterium]|nr:hypothetical protein [Hyphomicrobiaceae bacterium]
MIRLKKIYDDAGQTVVRAFPAPAIAFLAVAMSPPIIAALYLAKSALGINLMPGHSPLHDLLYHLVR